MFDSPFEHCPKCGAMVALDQSMTECAHEHRCEALALCPLQHLFSGHGSEQILDLNRETGNGQQS